MKLWLSHSLTLYLADWRPLFTSLRKLMKPPEASVNTFICDTISALNTTRCKTAYGKIEPVNNGILFSDGGNTTLLVDQSLKVMKL